MNDYAYQIQGALENSKGDFLGLRVIVCTVRHFDTVDVPVEILDNETVAYLKFRLKAIDYMDIRKLPIPIQNKIRKPLGRWLDRWVLDNLYGSSGKPKNTNT